MTSQDNADSRLPANRPAAPHRTPTVLSPPRHPVIVAALTMARDWCTGRTIDGAPALAHAVRVAVKLGEHVPHTTPELVAAVLLHDSPYFAPRTLNLDAHLTARLGAEVARVVRALEVEHEALSDPAPVVREDDPPTLCASAADKIVSLASVLHRATLADDQPAYWAARRPFLRLVPYFRAFHTATATSLPHTMAEELGDLVAHAAQVHMIIAALR